MSQNSKDPIDRVLDKLDKMEDRLDSIDKTLVKNTASLEEHMRRSDLLEKSQDELKHAVAPLLKVHTAVVVALKGLAVIATILGILKFFL